jgi:hypothetical protein
MDMDGWMDEWAREGVGLLGVCAVVRCGVWCDGASWPAVMTVCFIHLPHVVWQLHP